MPRKKKTITPFERQKICESGISCGFSCIGAALSCKTTLAGKSLETAKQFKGLVFEFDPELKEVVATIGGKRFDIDSQKKPEEENSLKIKE